MVRRPRSIAWKSRPQPRPRPRPQSWRGPTGDNTPLRSPLEIGPPGAAVLARSSGSVLGCRVFRQIDGSAGGIATMGQRAWGALAGRDRPTRPVYAVALASARLQGAETTHPPLIRQSQHMTSLRNALWKHVSTVVNCFHASWIISSSFHHCSSSLGFRACYAFLGIAFVFFSLFGVRSAFWILASFCRVVVTCIISCINSCLWDGWWPPRISGLPKSKWLG